jgi:four helix bundle protein
MENKIYNLEDRLKSFHIRTIRLCKRIGNTPITSRIISQIVACSGSAGANYCEASEAMSKRDFVKSLKTSRKELREYSIWIAGLKEAADFTDSEFDALLQESKELTYIFTSIIKKADV